MEHRRPPSEPGVAPPYSSTMARAVCPRPPTAPPLRYRLPPGLSRAGFCGDRVFWGWFLLTIDQDF